MKYEVIRYFTDAQDNEYAYHEGDSYPRGGLNPSEQRIKDLMSGNNYQKVALIKPFKGNAETKVESKVETKVESTEEPKEEVKAATEDGVDWTADEIDRMPFMKLKSIAKKNGVDVENKKADAIRSELKEKLEL